ncbi:Rieske [2Fe-2S] iron-sulfur domain containing protein [Amanita muscaria]
MSTKTIAVLDESDLLDGQMKQVEFDKGHVLLSRIGDNIHANSAFCTHYGAPLAKGVLTSDGRVVCPWHGACFNVCTGDIEDAPAPTALHSFKTHVKDGKIYVTANVVDALKENKERQPTLLNTSHEVGQTGLVIIGGGSGAFYAIESLREHGYAAPITILSKETNLPLDRTKLSKALITNPAQIEWRTAADLKIKYGTSVRLGVEVTSVDLANKKPLGEYPVVCLLKVPTLKTCTLSEEYRTRKKLMTLPRLERRWSSLEALSSGWNWSPLC